jgi:transcriptional regulator with XRE-family HTH domain
MHSEKITMDPTFMKIRAKKLGIYLREARISKGKNIEELSSAAGVPSDALEAYEEGVISPSLPELELLAYRLRTPLEHFIDGGAYTTEELRPINPDRFLGIRQRIIGTQLRKTQVEAEVTLEDISQKTGIDIDTLNSYEMGMIPIPLPQLENLLSVLNVSMRDFQDKHGPVGDWLTEQQQVNDFLELPENLRAFVSKPVHVPYLELAMRLSEMSVEKLRAVAEGLLEITL